MKVIGLGLPSQMAEYIGDGEEDICPVMYIWDPVEMGKVAALVSMGLWSGDIEEQPGEDILLDNGRTYRIDTGYDGGLEIISGEPIRIDKDNIGYWETRL